MKLESLRHQSRGRQLVDQLQEQLACPPTPSLASMASHRRSKPESQSRRSLNERPLTVKPRIERDYEKLARKEVHQGALGAYGCIEAHVHAPPTEEEKRRHRHRHRGHRIPDDGLKPYGHHKAPRCAEEGDAHQDRPRWVGNYPSDEQQRPATSSSMGSYATPTMSQISKYVKAVEKVKLPSVKEDVTGPPPRPPPSASVRSSKPRQPGPLARKVLEELREDEILGGEEESNLPRLATSRGHERGGDGGGGRTERTERSKTSDILFVDDEFKAEYNHVLLNPTGHDTYFMKNVEPQEEFPHLRPALPRPPKHARGNEQFIKAKHNRRAVSRAGSLYSNGRSVCVSVDELLAERGHIPGHAPKNMATIAGGVDEMFPYRSPCNGDFMPKDRQYTPPKRIGEEKMREEWNQVVYELDRCYQKKGNLRLKRLFEQADVDKDGHMSMHQMKKVIHALNLNVTDAALVELLSRFPKGGDKKTVDYNELCQALHKRKIPYMEFAGRARLHPDPDLPFGNPGLRTQPYAILRDAPHNLKENQRSSVNKLQDVYQAFASVDRNQDGRVYPDDFMSTMRKLHLELSDREIRKLWHNADPLNQGFVDYRKFVKGIGPSGKEYYPEFLKPKGVRTSNNGPIWEWVVDNPFPKSRMPPYEGSVAGSNA
uniref:EF-hand domain-containing protein n=1 Tax=Pyramimonas obovata TaxID=1411642 RepID=A0A7S0WS24_9CHLO|mmetsp:Transcript_36176/g.78949  ORF Transcript_36176/g.78949 Transcript_36176/m.78949 type:complete len:656 (+) Transcript_36176:335-2302(+)